MSCDQNIMSQFYLLILTLFFFFKSALLERRVHTVVCPSVHKGVTWYVQSAHVYTVIEGISKTAKICAHPDYKFGLHNLFTSFYYAYKIFSFLQEK